MNWFKKITDETFNKWLFLSPLIIKPFPLMQANVMACVIMIINSEKYQLHLLLTITKKHRVQETFTQITSLAHKSGSTCKAGSLHDVTVTVPAVLRTL